jgi:hypothetical protein
MVSANGPPARQCATTAPCIAPHAPPWRQRSLSNADVESIWRGRTAIHSCVAASLRRCALHAFHSARLALTPPQASIMPGLRGSWRGRCVGVRRRRVFQSGSILAQNVLRIAPRYAILTVDTFHVECTTPQPRSRDNGHQDRVPQDRNRR